MDNISKKEFNEIDSVAQALGKSLLCCLKQDFPTRSFCVFVSVSVNDSLIIRFHQKWPGEEPYYSLSDSDNEKEKLFVFEN